MSSDSENFQAWVFKRWQDRQPDPRSLYGAPFSPIAALGLAGEVGEVLEPLKKHMRDGTVPNQFDLTNEMGDVLHYLTVLGQAYGITLEQMMRFNVAKLNDRDTKLRRVT